MTYTRGPNLLYCVVFWSFQCRLKLQSLGISTGYMLRKNLGNPERAQLMNSIDINKAVGEFFPAGLTPYSLKRLYVTLASRDGVLGISLTRKNVKHTENSKSTLRYIEASAKISDEILQKYREMLHFEPHDARAHTETSEEFLEARANKRTRLSQASRRRTLNDVTNVRNLKQ